MPGKPFAEVLRLVGAEVIHHQKRIEQRDLVESKDAPQVYARALPRGPALEDVGYSAGGRHRLTPFMRAVALAR
jgi:hypothetical protein